MQTTYCLPYYVYCTLYTVNTNSPLLFCYAPFYFPALLWPAQLLQSIGQFILYTVQCNVLGGLYSGHFTLDKALRTLHYGHCTMYNVSSLFIVIVNRVQCPIKNANITFYNRLYLVNKINKALHSSGYKYRSPKFSIVLYNTLQFSIGLYTSLLFYALQTVFI